MNISREALVACAVVVVSACSGGQDLTTPPTPAPTVTETFTGTLPPQGIATHTFNVSAAGAVTVRLTAAGPPDAIQVGLGAGTPISTGGCSVEIVVTTAAGTIPQVSGTARNAGPLCIAILDVGNLAAEIAYSIDVIHP